MNNPQQKPWAILLCKYRDDPDDPSVTRIADLWKQWGAIAITWVPAQSANDFRTILDVCKWFFTPTGAGTLNAVRY